MKPVWVEHSSSLNATEIQSAFKYARTYKNPSLLYTKYLVWKLEAHGISKQKHAFENVVPASI